MDLDIVSRALFPAPPASYGIDSFPGELIWVPRSLNPQTSSPEDCVPCLFLQCATARYLTIYLHGNAEDIGRCQQFCRVLRDKFHMHVLAVEYPGYGICPGTSCDERGATDSALTAFRFVREVLRWPLDSVMILGRSIGTGPAIALAAEHGVAGLILVSPFISVREVCREKLGPLAYMIEERFPNRDRIPMSRSPCLIVHGKKDTMIPHRHGSELFAACQCRKSIILPEEMDHNANLLESRDYFVSPMLDFFSIPDYSGKELVMPRWAFDKRLSPMFFQAKLPARSSVLWACATCAACSRTTNQRIVTQATARCGAHGQRRETDHVEETIAGAVEHVLSRKEDLVWAEAEEDPDGPSDPRRSWKSGRHWSGNGSGSRRDRSTSNERQVRAPKNIFGHIVPDTGAPDSEEEGTDIPIPPEDDGAPMVPNTTLRLLPGAMPLERNLKDPRDRPVPSSPGSCRQVSSAPGSEPRQIQARPLCSCAPGAKLWRAMPAASGFEGRA